MIKFSKLLLVTLFLQGSLFFAQQWQDVGLATISPSSSSFNNLAIDFQGNYYVSYYDLSTLKGSLQKFNGISWFHLGGNPGITTESATYSSLSLDNFGNIYYTNQWSYPNAGMEVRKFSGNSWTQLPNAFNVTTNYQASAVAPNNTLFVYGSANSGTVQRFANGAWEQVGMSGIAGATPFNAEMVIGSNGKVYVCHNASGVKVYENSLTATPTDTWTLTGGAPVGTSYTEGANATSDIAIGTDNSLYVVYCSTAANNRKLNVKKFNGNSWVQVGNPDFGISNNLYNVSIAVTPTGKLYVVASGWGVNSGKNTVYTIDTASNMWIPFGGDFVSDGAALYNDLQYDALTNTLVLTYSQNGVKVKKIPLSLPSSSCNSDPGMTPGNIGCTTFNYGLQSVTYTTVRANDGKIWLQQNLGSTKTAGTLTDSDAYGDLFQWGRWNDGHQLRNSSLSSTPPSPNNPSGLNGVSSTFYSTAYNSSSNFWSNGLTSDTWTAENALGATATNGADPCKAIGLNWRLPTVSEINTVIAAENITEYNSALTSNLKLIPAGMKDYNGIFSPGTRLYVWSSTSSPYTGSGQHLYISQHSALSNSAGRDAGMSVRCIKDIAGLSTSDVKKVEARVYPNPTNGIIYIKTDSEVETLNLINTVGQRMNVNFSNDVLNMQSLPKGIYILELKMKNGQKIYKKIIKY